LHDPAIQLRFIFFLAVTTSTVSFSDETGFKLKAIAISASPNRHRVVTRLALSDESANDMLRQ
jgi:hypothetical protein